MQSELFTVYSCLISKWSLVDFFGQNFWQTGGLKQKREAVRSPKSREVFNSRRENHMYAICLNTATKKFGYRDFKVLLFNKNLIDFIKQ